MLASKICINRISYSQFSNSDSQNLYCFVLLLTRHTVPRHCIFSALIFLVRFCLLFLGLLQFFTCLAGAQWQPRRFIPSEHMLFKHFQFVFRLLKHKNSMDSPATVKNKYSREKETIEDHNIPHSFYIREAQRNDTYHSENILYVSSNKIA